MRARRAEHAGLVIAGVSLAYWVATVFLCDATYFGDAAAVSARGGYLAVYWSGAEADRNSQVLNNWVWPWYSSGAGAEWSLDNWGRWMVYGPGALLSTPFLTHLWAYPQNAGFFLPGVGASRGVHYVGVPVWCVCVLGCGLWLPAAWWRRRRPRQDECPRCGYSLAGLKAEAPCPECASLRGPLVGSKLPMPTRVELIGETVAVFARKVRFESFTWDKVESVRAWKQDCFGVDRIWIGFDVPGREEPVCVHEECEGYSELLAEMEKRCPGSTPDWLRTVMFPAFATNHTLVWERPRRGGIPPLSSVPNVNEGDVERIVRRDYPPAAQVRVLALLDQIGEHASARVRLAALKIALGDLGRLQSGVELARSDYRDALVAAEYRRAWTYTPPTTMFPTPPPGGIEGARQADWDEYHTWLLAGKPQVAPPDA